MNKIHHEYTFIFEGKPMTKDNVKARGKHGKYYLPPALKQYENYIQLQFLQQKPRGFEMYDTPVKVQMKFYFPDNRRRDIVNYTKSICDALSMLLYKDDSLIGEITLYKCFSKKLPRTEVYIQTL